MNKLITAAFLATAFATPALAEDGLYYGLGLGYSSMTSTLDSDPLSSSFEGTVLGVTLGYRRDASSMFYAAEMDSDLGLGQQFSFPPPDSTCRNGAIGPTHCTHDITLRMRGVVGTQVGAYELFGSLGAVLVKGTSAVEEIQVDDVINTGYTVGLGVQRPLGSGTGRLELIYDRADNDNGPKNGLSVYHPNYEAVTLKATFMF